MIRAVPSGGWLKVSRGLESQALGLSVGPTVLEAQTGASGALLDVGQAQGGRRAIPGRASDLGGGLWRHPDLSLGSTL